MDAKTGDILGVASSPSFDPNKRNISNYENPLTTYVYEPGSTMKTFTYMCAIDKGTYNPSATYTSGKYKVGEDVIQDWNGGLGWGNITYDKGYEYSSNVGIANLLKNYLSKKDLKECFSKYGFGKKTGIELSREMTGNTKFSYDVEYITSGFGQGITSTIVQQLQALTIISNNGKMLKPHIIKKMVDTNNNEVTYKRKIEQSEQLVKSETVSKIKELMYNVIHGKDPGSTGYPYRIDGFDIIGKTGTSQIYDEKTGAWLKGENNYIFSFSGMYPKDNPEIIIYAAMRRPTNGKSAGLYTAVTDVMKSIAKYKNMFGDSKKESTSGNYKLNSYINKDTDAVKSELSNNGINTIVIGNGKKIIKQYPASGTDILTSDKVFLITNDTQGKIPSMIGWSRSEAIKFLELVGISYETEGYGYVTEQSLNTNTLITTKDKMHLKFNNKYDIDKEQQTKDN
jgi:penicillin-binding protein 2B